MSYARMFLFKQKGAGFATNDAMLQTLHAPWGAARTKKHSFTTTSAIVTSIIHVAYSSVVVHYELHIRARHNSLGNKFVKTMFNRKFDFDGTIVRQIKFSIAQLL
ncbi:MAG: hypothetical protein V1656_02540 [Candidatus Jorgensenbacteria bacterium]